MVPLAYKNDSNRMKWNLKLVIIGNPARGKTSLRRSFIGKKFRVNYLPTLGADFSYLIKEKEDDTFNITLWDLSGQPRFKNVHPQYYIGSHGAIVVYDINDAKGDPIDTLIGWIDQYTKHASEAPNKVPGPVLIIMNKIDLIDDDNRDKFDNKHEDTMNHLRRYYNNSIDLIGGITSAKTGENVVNVIEDFISQIIEFQKKKHQEVEVPKSSNESFILTSYLMGLDEVIGPVILARYPPQQGHKYSNQEVTSLVRLSTAIDFEELARTSYETGVAMWSDPPSHLYYVTFVIPNEEARGGFNLFIIGVTIGKHLKTVISGKQTLINGNLLKYMNQMSELIAGHDLMINTASEEIMELRENEHKNKLAIGHLKELMENMNTLIEDILD